MCSYPKTYIVHLREQHEIESNGKKIILATSKSAEEYMRMIQEKFPELSIELNDIETFKITFSSEEEYQLVTDFMDKNKP